jgi:hypothetical protein
MRLGAEMEHRMGYTHYWSFKASRGDAKQVEAKYQRAVKACDKVVKFYSKLNGGLSGYSAHAKGYGGINVNGSGDDGHETFILREHYSQNEAGNFCKTAQKPYDIVVVACLIILQHYLGTNIEVGSDGDVSEWHDGMQLAQKISGLKTLKVPNGTCGANNFAV